MKARAHLIEFTHAQWQRKGLLSTALLPLAWITAGIVKAKKRRAQRNPCPSWPLPTIVVGNIVVGGTGKTPVVIALVQHLQSCGWKPGVISRGYGARLGPVPRTGQGLLQAQDFGDEPALIAQSTGAPVAVHPNRPLARQALCHDFPQVNVIVSDDGLQHLALSRDIEILVQDERGIGNGRLLPAGPLREPADKLAQVDIVIDNNGHKPAPIGHKGPLRLNMALVPLRVEHLVSGRQEDWTAWRDTYAQSPIAAVAAIGQPARFFSMLRHNGLQPTSTLALPDHDAYAHTPFAALHEKTILITAKDAVKCRHFADPRIWVVHVMPRFSDPSWLDRLTNQLKRLASEKSRKSITL